MGVDISAVASFKGLSYGGMYLPPDDFILTVRPLSLGGRGSDPVAVAQDWCSVSYATSVLWGKSVGFGGSWELSCRLLQGGSKNRLKQDNSFSEHFARWEMRFLCLVLT